MFLPSETINSILDSPVSISFTVSSTLSSDKPSTKSISVPTSSISSINISEDKSESSGKELKPLILSYSYPKDFKDGKDTKKKPIIIATPPPTPTPTPKATPIPTPPPKIVKQLGARNR
jgi:hypothetical protein